MKLEQLEQEALKLSEEERTILAAHLLNSLPDDLTETENAWYEEAEHRYQEYKAGKMSAKSAPDVFKDAYQKPK